MTMGIRNTDGSSSSSCTENPSQSLICKSVEAIIKHWLYIGSESFSCSKSGQKIFCWNMKHLCEDWNFETMFGIKIEVGNQNFTTVIFFAFDFIDWFPISIASNIDPSSGFAWLIRGLSFRIHWRTRFEASKTTWKKFLLHYERKYLFSFLTCLLVIFMLFLPTLKFLWWTELSAWVFLNSNLSFALIKKTLSDPFRFTVVSTKSIDMKHFFLNKRFQFWKKNT